MSCAWLLTTPIYEYYVVVVLWRSCQTYFCVKLWSEIQLVYNQLKPRDRWPDSWGIWQLWTNVSAALAATVMINFRAPTHYLFVTTAALAAENVCARELPRPRPSVLPCNYANMLIACVIDSENDDAVEQPFQFWPPQRKQPEPSQGKCHCRKNSCFAGNIDNWTRLPIMILRFLQLKS